MVQKEWIDDLNSVKGSIVYFKINLRKVFEAVCSGARKNQELSTNIGYVVSNHLFHESWIDDMDRDIKELLGNIDIIVEDVHKMVNMTQCSHFQETTTNIVQPMEEVSLSKHNPCMEAKKKK